MQLSRLRSALPLAAAPLILNGVSGAPEVARPPWPALLISSGRRAGKIAAAIRKRSRGAVIAVHLQDPLIAPDAFDLVVPMVHDGLAGPNVLPVLTSLHDVTSQALAGAADRWRARLTHLRRPLTGVLVGGAISGRAFPAEAVRALIAQLRAHQRATGSSLVISPSRRTPRTLRSALAAAFPPEADAWCWDLEGDNPYLGILALSDTLVVTGDSVSMISEALATSASVRVFDWEARGRRVRFVESLLMKGLVAKLSDGSRQRARRPFDATEMVAEAVRALYRTRTGSSG